ncbi:MAG: PD-(D/E)XK nuclease family protein [Limnohabitans sp.]|nr:PD-(D/E)XK nuclease family protein [Limnohabitans sp.]
MKKPNLFNWATSELSQDAFICWLLSWANYPDNESLFNTAKYLINQLTENKIDNFEKIEIIRQRYNIDILCIIDKKNAILIEDKTNTKNHSNQLENYLQKLSKDFPRENIFPIYFKTGDQSNFQSINKAGYKLFLRPDFLEILKFGKEQNISNAIFNDFNEYLNNIENSVQSYKLLPVKNWHWDSWKGFYSALQKQLNDGNWDYVPQKNGGFLGFWWYWLSKEFDSVKFDYYLQLEHNKFCFKLYPYKRDKAELIRNHYRQLLYKKAKEHNINLYQNGRVGNYMTVAALKDNYISVDENGIIDMDKTVQTLKKIQNMLKEI